VNQHSAKTLIKKRVLQKVSHKVLTECPLCEREMIGENLNKNIVFIVCTNCGVIIDWYDKRTVETYRRGDTVTKYRDEWIDRFEFNKL
jgi:transcription elongation factor Elf1